MAQYQLLACECAQAPHGRAVPLLDVDQAGVDLPVAVRGLGDAGAGPGGVEELRDPVGGAARVLRVGVPAALLAPEVLEAGELAAVAAQLAHARSPGRSPRGATAAAVPWPGAGGGLASASGGLLPACSGGDAGGLGLRQRRARRARPGRRRPAPARRRCGRRPARCGWRRAARAGGRPPRRRPGCSSAGMPSCCGDAHRRRLRGVGLGGGLTGGQDVDHERAGGGDAQVDGGAAAGGGRRGSRRRRGRPGAGGCSGAEVHGVRVLRDFGRGGRPAQGAAYCCGRVKCSAAGSGPADAQRRRSPRDDPYRLLPVQGVPVGAPRGGSPFLPWPPTELADGFGREAALPAASQARGQDSPQYCGGSPARRRSVDRRDRRLGGVRRGLPGWGRDDRPDLPKVTVVIES